MCGSPRLAAAAYRNLTQGKLHDIINPLVRTLGFSADGSLVTFWQRRPDSSRSGDTNILSMPTQGGSLQTYLPDVAEVSWSRDGGRIVYHSSAPGDPLFVRDVRQTDARRIYTAPAGVHCHFPVWSLNDEFIYFVRGVPLDAWDIWRIRPSGADLERITFQDSRVSHLVLIDSRTVVYLATDSDGSGPWLYAIDVKERVARRISFGLERYTSLAASADGSRLVATVANPKTSLWDAVDSGSRHRADQRRAHFVGVGVAAGAANRSGLPAVRFLARRPAGHRQAGQRNQLASCGATRTGPSWEHRRFRRMDAASRSPCSTALERCCTSWTATAVMPGW